jgi:hypothetical protein
MPTTRQEALAYLAQLERRQAAEEAALDPWERAFKEDCRRTMLERERRAAQQMQPG